MELVIHEPRHSTSPARRSAEFASQPKVIVVDNDEKPWAALGRALQALGVSLEITPQIPHHFADERPDMALCIIVPATPRSGGLQFLRQLDAARTYIPLVFVADFANVSMSVEAMKSGAVDFLCRPYRDDDLLAAIEIGLARDRDWCERRRSYSDLARRYETLSKRERQVMELVVKGKMNKQIAFALGISEITVKAHRGKLMRKIAARSLPDLTRMADAISQRCAPVDGRSCKLYAATSGSSRLATVSDPDD